MTSDQSPRRVLYLVIEGLAPGRLEELRQNIPQSSPTSVEIISLTESNSAEALEKIFEADSVAVWEGLI